MFRFAQEPSSGSYFVLSKNYIYGSIVLVVPSSTVYRTLAHRLVCRHDIDHVSNDEHNRTTIVVLAKHDIAP